MSTLRLPKFLGRRHLSTRRTATIANGCTQLRIVGDVHVATPQPVAPPLPTVDRPGLSCGGHVGGSFERRARRTAWCTNGDRLVVARTPSFAPMSNRKAA